VVKRSCTSRSTRTPSDAVAATVTHFPRIRPWLTSNLRPSLATSLHFLMHPSGDSQNGVQHTGAQLQQLPQDEVHPTGEAAHCVATVPEGQAPATERAADSQFAGAAPSPPAGEPISVGDRASYLLMAHCSMPNVVPPTVGPEGLDFATTDALLRAVTAVFKPKKASAHASGLKARLAGVRVGSADAALCMVAADASGVALNELVGAGHPSYQAIAKLGNILRLSITRLRDQIQQQERSWKMSAHKDPTKAPSAEAREARLAELRRSYTCPFSPAAYAKAMGLATVSPPPAPEGDEATARALQTAMDAEALDERQQQEANDAALARSLEEDSLHAVLGDLDMAKLEDVQPAATPPAQAPPPPRAGESRQSGSRKRKKPSGVDPELANLAMVRGKPARKPLAQRAISACMPEYEATLAARRKAKELEEENQRQAAKIAELEAKAKRITAEREQARQKKNLALDQVKQVKKALAQEQTAGKQREANLKRKADEQRDLREAIVITDKQDREEREARERALAAQTKRADESTRAYRDMSVYAMDLEDKIDTLAGQVDDARTAEATAKAKAAEARTRAAEAETMARRAQRTADSKEQKADKIEKARDFWREQHNNKQNENQNLKGNVAKKDAQIKGMKRLRGDEQKLLVGALNQAITKLEREKAHAEARYIKALEESAEAKAEAKKAWGSAKYAQTEAKRKVNLARKNADSKLEYANHVRKEAKAMVDDLRSRDMLDPWARDTIRTLEEAQTKCVAALKEKEAALKEVEQKLKESEAISKPDLKALQNRSTCARAAQPALRSRLEQRDAHGLGAPPVSRAEYRLGAAYLKLQNELNVSTNSLQEVMLIAAKGLGVDLSNTTTTDAKGCARVRGLFSRSSLQGFTRMLGNLCDVQAGICMMRDMGRKVCGSLNGWGAHDDMSVAGKHYSATTLRTASGTITLDLQHVSGRGDANAKADEIEETLKRVQKAREEVEAECSRLGKTSFAGVGIGPIMSTAAKVKFALSTVFDGFSTDSASVEQATVKELARRKQAEVAAAELHEVQKQLEGQSGEVVVEDRAPNADGTESVATKKFTLPSLPAEGGAISEEIARARQDVQDAILRWKETRRSADRRRYKDSLAYVNCLLHACMHALIAGSDAVEDELVRILPDGFLDEMHKVLTGSSPSAAKDGARARGRAPQARPAAHRPCPAVRGPIARRQG